MTFAIITHVPHIQVKNQYFGYSPYVREMNIWTKYADKVVVVAPMVDGPISEIDSNYEHQNIEFVTIESFDVLRLQSIFQTIFKLPKICWQIYVAMQQADHIHLRCPGNMGLIGSLMQIFFPKKIKTAKYAGNWDPKSKQPLSYLLQKWILSNTFLTRNMQVLVYGEWTGSSRNIKPFFTASYREEEKVSMIDRDLKKQIHFIFVGTLVSGKKPSYALQLVEELFNKGYNVGLTLYGEGIERKNLETDVHQRKLNKIISLAGNQNQEKLKQAYQSSHFVILPSESEGWPKAIAEAMFWGCVPVATSVSCVPFMLDYGERGILLERNLEQDVYQLETLLKNENQFQTMSKKASEWSQKYTLNIFEEAIKKLVQQ